MKASLLNNDLHFRRKPNAFLTLLKIVKIHGIPPLSWYKSSGTPPKVNGRTYYDNSNGEPFAFVNL